MNILVTNDDGIYAEGILHLVNKLKRVATVFVIAPDREKSATGHAITIHDPLRVTKFHGFSDGVKAYHVDGTPADCVKLGVSTLLDDKPDLVISGINAGPNLGLDVLYSGTIAGAIEGVVQEVPSIAISLGGHDDFNFEKASDIVMTILLQLLETDFLSKKTVVNINIPPLNSQDIKGVKFTKLGIRKYTNFYEHRSDPRGKSYYWLAGDLMELTNTLDTDVHAVDNYYVSITPLHFDFTSHKDLERMKQSNFHL
ncbi:5'/3'-nucleotidase SurE [Desulfuribacillus stibiiarsenatis]|uniref:5'-nucleotidase SurE n=1 Tax=Desulfuribacillus stibiiarsenatis TaxID=1390249 RepID=A0A1E5L3U2_9FIRM|nr:5'/3'-nucleotidase SurE [Desulfuribacillus stibiiarsenatis]OEH84818.1 5'/3'-nucleotidase SurE [Desulfuribacillus stibiiarsenatis]